MKKDMGEKSIEHSLGKTCFDLSCSQFCLPIPGEGDAACGLGGVYQQMGEYEKALQYHQLDLQLAEMTSNPVCQCKFVLYSVELFSLIIPLKN